LKKTGDKMGIAEKLKELRVKKGLTQEALGLLSGLGRVYINHVEKGRYKNITIQTAQKLAEALGVSTDELLEGETSGKTRLPEKSLADMFSLFTSDFADKLQKLEVVEIISTTQTLYCFSVSLAKSSTSSLKLTIPRKHHGTVVSLYNVPKLRSYREASVHSGVAGSIKSLLLKKPQLLHLPFSLNSCRKTMANFNTIYREYQQMLYQI